MAKKPETLKPSGADARKPVPAPTPPPAPPASKGGFLKRLFGGASKSADNGDTDEPTGPIITLFTGRVKPLPAEQAKPEPPKSEPAKPAAPKP